MPHMNYKETKKQYLYAYKILHFKSAQHRAAKVKTTSIIWIEYNYITHRNAL